MKRPRFSYANVASTLALGLVLTGGTAIAANTIGSADIVNNSIKSVDVKNNTLKSADLRDNSIRSRDIKDNTVKSVDIKDGVVKSADIKNGSIELGDISQAALDALGGAGGQGPAGPTGAQGPAGPAGPSGLQGPAGISGLQVVTRLFVPTLMAPGQRRTRSATCPIGKDVIGGGVHVSGEAVLFANSPGTSRSWRGGIVNRTDSPAAADLQIWALCATVD